MAKAYKCDRCNKFYEKFGGDELDNTLVVIDYHRVGQRALDLCVDCHHELTEWLSSTGLIKKERL